MSNIRLFALAVLLLIPGLSFANQTASGFCTTGGIKVTTFGSPSSNPVQGSYPGCLITVNIHGGGLATITDANGGPLSNPFTASSLTGFWEFSAANGFYDVTLSGGTPALPSPLTIVNLLLNDPGTAAITASSFTGSGFISSTALVATSGTFRCASVDNCLNFRNNANTLDLAFKKTGAAAGNLPADVLDASVFGGLKSLQFFSNTAQSAAIGILSCAAGDTCVAFRNQANSGDVSALAKDSSDRVIIGGAAGFTASIGNITNGLTVGAGLTVGGASSLQGVTTTTVTASGEIAPSITGGALGDTAHRFDAFIRNVDISGTVTGGITTGSGTANSIAKFISASILGNSGLFDNGTTISTVENGLFGGTFGATGGFLQDTVVGRTRDCRADGMKADGVTDDSAAWNTCHATGKANSQTTFLIPCGTIILTANTINGTNFPGIHDWGCGFQPDATNPPTQGQGITNVICNQGTTKSCMSYIGSAGAEVDHMVVNVAKGVQGAGIGIVQGRDNSGGGGSGNPLCFMEGYNFHDLYITDNGGSNTALNSGRGFIGIYNVSAENGLYSNLHVLTDTPNLFSQNNVLGYVDPFVTIQTGCPPSMTGVTMVNPVLTSSATTLPLIEANITNAFSLFGFQCVGGNACIKFENTLGATPTAGWVVTGLTEQSTSDIIASSVNLANMKFFMLIANPPPGFVFKPLAANLTFDQMDFLIDDFFALVPFIDNVQTGTQIRGSKIHIGAATSASNTTLLNTQVFAPTLTDAQMTFNAASNYERYDSSGISIVGPFRADRFLAGDGNTNLTSYGEASDPTTGMFFNVSQILWSVANGAKMELTPSELRFGSGISIGFSSNANPAAAGSDANVSRIAAGVIGVGTGAAGSFAGGMKESFHVFAETNSPSIGAGTDVCYGDSTAHNLRCSMNNGGFQNYPISFALHSSYSNSTTTFSNVSDGTRTMSWPVLATTDYMMDCTFVGQGSATTAGPKFQLTGPATPTLVKLLVDGGTNTTAYANGNVTGFSTANTTLGTLGAGTTDFIWHINASIANGANAGTLTLQAAANGTGTLTISGGSCQLQ